MTEVVMDPEDQQVVAEQEADLDLEIKEAAGNNQIITDGEQSPSFFNN